MGRLGQIQRHQDHVAHTDNQEKACAVRTVSSLVLVVYMSPVPNPLHALSAPTEPVPSGMSEPETGHPSRAAIAGDQALTDTTSRTMGSLYVCVALWLLITLAAGLHKTHPQLVWGCTIWLGSIAAARTMVAHRLQKLLELSPMLAHRLTGGLVLANGLTWGLLSALSVRIPALEAIRTPMLLVGMGLASGGAVALAINPMLRVWFPVSVLAPVAIAMASHTSDGNLMLAGLMVAYAVYTMQVARTVSQDYWSAQQAFKALEHVSLTDPLTQVPNRLHFERQYQLEWLRACRLNTRIAVMIVDLDHFKRINDEHGHPAGDLVLQEVAKAMAAAIMRPCDLLARYGGDEFIVLLPDISEEGAQVVAERLRAQLEELKIVLPSGGISITCSVGYAGLIPGHELEADDLVRQADEALYQAKMAGRNCIRGWAQIGMADQFCRPAEINTEAT